MGETRFFYRLEKIIQPPPPAPLKKKNYPPKKTSPVQSRVQSSFSIWPLKYPHDFSLNLVKQTTCGHSFYIVHAKKASSCFMRKIKGLKCFLLTFLKKRVFNQWICGHAMKCHTRHMQNSPNYDFTEISPSLYFFI